jgi:(+)-delta-cadinene synthase
MAPGEKSSQKLNFINTIQRLGVSYHFEKEILQQLHKTLHDYEDDDDLYTVALRFWLLRHHGYYISCGAVVVVVFLLLLLVLNNFSVIFIWEN